MKLILIIIILCVVTTSCKKSDSTTQVPPTTCPTCILTANKWNLEKETTITDAGSYAFPAEQGAAGNIDWKFFIFNQNQTYQDNESNGGTYIYYDGTPGNQAALVLSPGNGSFNYNFSIQSISHDSLVLSLPKLQVHPLTDLSDGAIAEDIIFLTDLHDNAGVDTSKVIWIQPVFKYTNGGN